MVAKTLKYVAFTLLILALASAHAQAQSRLEKCSETQYTRYNNCIGTWSDGRGNTYVGEWQSGSREGQGEAIMANGDKYVGEFKFNKKNGRGVMMFSNGDEYVGEVKDDALSGQGTYIFGEGLYKGEWYIGEFKDDAFNGQGTYTFANGNKIVGQFQNGTLNGNGVDYAPDGEILEQGIYQNGKLVLRDNGVSRQSSRKNRVQMFEEGGTYVVPVFVNDVLSLNFVVDSGATDVMIPADVAMTLFRAGTIKDEDFLGNQRYLLADGSVINSKQFLIRSLRVGDQIVTNVRGSISDVHGSLLLGQSFLGMFKSWSMDNASHELVLE